MRRHGELFCEFKQVVVDDGDVEAVKPVILVKEVHQRRVC